MIGVARCDTRATADERPLECHTVGTRARYARRTMAHDEFIALVTRLEQASDVLRNAGCLMQAIARRYYLVYAYAAQAAEKHGVTFRRGAHADDDRRLTHQALPLVVAALYSGQNRGAVLGGGPRRDSQGTIDRCTGSELYSRPPVGP